MNSEHKPENKSHSTVVDTTTTTAPSPQAATFQFVPWPIPPAAELPKPLEHLCDPPDEKPTPTTDALDDVLRIAARLIVLGIGAFILYGMFLVVFFNESQRTKSLFDSLHILSDEWKALLIVIIPVFYLPIRRLIYRARSFAAGHDAANAPNSSPAMLGKKGTE